MRFPKLRIAWSVRWGVACVLVVVLWVRSYKRADSLGISRVHVLTSIRGGIYVGGQTSVSRHDLDDLEFHWCINNQVHLLSATVKKLVLVNNPVTRYNVHPFGSYVAVPYWLATCLVVILSAAPWIRRRFSLRTLLIATTSIALVLALSH
jgi:hypothetical protein